MFILLLYHSSLLAGGTRLPLCLSLGAAEVGKDCDRRKRRVTLVSFFSSCSGEGGGVSRNNLSTAVQDEVWPRTNSSVPTRPTMPGCPVDGTEIFPC